MAKYTFARCCVNLDGMTGRKHSASVGKSWISRNSLDKSSQARWTKAGESGTSLSNCWISSRDCKETKPDHWPKPYLHSSCRRSITQATHFTNPDEMPGDPLDPALLTNRLPNLLPEAAKKLSSAQDGLAALLHTAMAELGFRLIAIDEHSPLVPDLNNILPENWAKNGPGDYTFRYKHDQSSLEFLLKVSKLGNRTLFHAIALEARRFPHLHSHSCLIRM